MNNRTLIGKWLEYDTGFLRRTVLQLVDDGTFAVKDGLVIRKRDMEALQRIVL